MSEGEEKKKQLLVQRRRIPSTHESMSRMTKPIKRGSDPIPPFSIGYIINDIIHNKNYNKIKYRYIFMNEKYQNIFIIIVLVSIGTYIRSPIIVKSELPKVIIPII